MLQKLKRNRKGFTLAELLIVVAVIAVMIAIAIPTFSNALNKAEAAVHQSNARAIHAEAMSNYLFDTATTPATTYYGTLGGVDYTWTYGSPNASVSHTCTVTGCTSPQSFSISSGMTTTPP